jgi:hypothetical protein
MDQPLLYSAVRDSNGMVNKVVVYAVASILSFIVYIYLVKKFVDIDKRDDFIKRQLMNNTGAYATNNMLNAGVRYLTGAL